MYGSEQQNVFISLFYITVVWTFNMIRIIHILKSYFIGPTDVSSNSIHNYQLQNTQLVCLCAPKQTTLADITAFTPPPSPYGRRRRRRRSRRYSYAKSVRSSLSHWISGLWSFAKRSLSTYAASQNSHIAFVLCIICAIDVNRNYNLYVLACVCVRALFCSVVTMYVCVCVWAFFALPAGCGEQMGRFCEPALWNWVLADRGLELITIIRWTLRQIRRPSSFGHSSKRLTRIIAPRMKLKCASRHLWRAQWKCISVSQCPIVWWVHNLSACHKHDNCIWDIFCPP